ncbi:MAG TPA: hypothetical protein VH157_12030 [Bryobacteraceae bacterium]|nr:hypothetical protein [Bryobacteraceae bacterium]
MKTRILITPALACALLLAGVSSLTAGLTGAIFTTNSNGTVVNGNQYDSPCSVYLDGGPGLHAPAHAAGLPDGGYYFQVTDPSGKTLLSTDPVANRHFIVSGGIITAYVGDGSDPIHLTGPNQNDPGGVTIRLANLSCPTDFLATSNNGGAYKVWVTPIANFNGNPALVDNPCGNGCFHGFVPSASKTDNFKVNTAAATFCLTVEKLFQQTDSSGKVTLVPQQNWPFVVTDPLTVPNTFYTDTTGQVVVCDLAPGTYVVAEDPSSSVLSINANVLLIPVTGIATSTSFTWTITQPAQPAVGIVFTNQVPQPGIN